MPAQDADDELITRTAAGDARAFEAIVDRHAPAVTRLARAMTGDAATADDVTQEAFLAAFRAAAGYRPGVSSVRTWLFAIARNAARHARRVGAREHVAVEDELMALGVEAGWGAADAADELERAEETERIARAIAALDADDREVVVLRDLEGLSGEASAGLLGLGVPAMKSRLHRARLRLVAALREGQGDVVEHQREVGGLSCGEVLARLGEYVDGELIADEVSRVEAHLLRCTVCARFGGRYAGVVQATRTRLGAPPALDLFQLERIRARLRG